MSESTPQEYLVNSVDIEEREALLGDSSMRVRVVGLGYGTDDESTKMRKFFEAGNAYTLKKLQEHFAGS
jgi:hypothetical protein